LADPFWGGRFRELRSGRRQRGAELRTFPPTIADEVDHESESMTESEESFREDSRDHRFAFGKNWAKFLKGLDEARILAAVESLKQLLRVESLEGQSLLDVGSGSGLFSLAALRLGATNVRSFDYDPDSVKCATWLRERFAGTEAAWVIEQGDILDLQYLEALGTFDIVYSWGVLHHTGKMWQALDNISQLVCAGGKLVVAIYNDQGWLTSYWKIVKHIYNTGSAGKALMRAIFIPYFFGGSLFKDLLHFTNPLDRYRSSPSRRGMSMLTDWDDWLGGYPFEVAKPQTVIEFYESKGFSLERVVLVGGKLGCNEFAFLRSSISAEAGLRATQTKDH